MKKIIFIITFTISLINAQEVTLTLEESFEIGLYNSKELSIANSQITKADASVSEISALMLPKLSLNAGYAKLSDVPPFQVSLPSLPKPITIQESILDNYTLNARIEQPLFTGFKLSSLRSAAKFNKLAVEIDYEKEILNKQDDIQKAFWNYYLSLQLVDLITDNLNALNSHLKNTNSFLEQGYATKNDFLKLKVEVTNAELKLLEAQNNSNKAQALFNKTIGLPLDNKTNISVNELWTENVIDDYNELLLQARLNRQEIKAIKFQVEALKEKENAAMSEWYPQLYAFGNINYNNPNQRYMPLENKFNDSWDVGLALKWDVWNWGGTSAKVEQAKQSQYQAETSLKLLRENVELDVYNNFLNIQKSAKEIELSELQVESAEENYRITEKKYNQQLATSTDLIDAETVLINAETGLIRSKVNYQMNIFALNKSLGKKIN
ncbi:MAG: TolC family protein [Melioribacteraceae bacterium]|nr:TolC family protein [Melioribacteraceae bacterium]